MVPRRHQTPVQELSQGRARHPRAAYARIPRGASVGVRLYRRHILHIRRHRHQLMGHAAPRVGVRHRDHRCARLCGANWDDSGHYECASGLEVRS